MTYFDKRKISFLVPGQSGMKPLNDNLKLRQAVDLCLIEEISARKKLNLNPRIDILSLLLQARDETGNFLTDGLNDRSGANTNIV